MKNLNFSNNDLWFQFWFVHPYDPLVYHDTFYRYYEKFFIYLKFRFFMRRIVRNFHLFFYLKLSYFCFLLKILLNRFLIKNKNNINNFIQKGYKTKNLGIYIRNFLKNNNILTFSHKYCYLIMRFKRKNLFLTLLNKDGNVFCKTNIGSCGFKKKVKYTGYAIKRTSRRFSKKILGSFIKTVFFTKKSCIKNLYKIKELIFIKKKIQNLNLKNFLKRKKVKKNKKIIYKKKYIKNIIKINNKKIIRDKIIKNKIITKFDNYRNYPYYVNSIKKAFKIKIRIKSNFKFWGYRFVMYGLAKKFRWFNGLEIRLPVPHSKGLRLRKKRRV